MEFIDTQVYHINWIPAARCPISIFFNIKIEHNAMETFFVDMLNKNGELSQNKIVSKCYMYEKIC